MVDIARAVAIVGNNMLNFEPEKETKIFPIQQDNELNHSIISYQSGDHL